MGKKARNEKIWHLETGDPTQERGKGISRKLKGGSRMAAMQQCPHSTREGSKRLSQEHVERRAGQLAAFRVN